MADAKRLRAARHAQPGTAPLDPRQKPPITVDRITDAALQVVATHGYDALTMRRVAAVLDTGPASLYAHVVNKADLDELIIGRLFSRLTLPEPDPARWREQITGICVQVRDQFLAYPGVARASLAMAATNLDVLRLGETMLAVLLAGGVAPQTAAWAIDHLSLYICAYTLEQSVVAQRRDRDDEQWVVGRDDLIARFTALPADTFPQTRKHATELTAGTGHDRFDFSLRLILDNLAAGR